MATRFLLLVLPASCFLFIYIPGLLFYNDIVRMNIFFNDYVKLSNFTLGLKLTAFLTFHSHGKVFNNEHKYGLHEFNLSHSFV